MFSLFCLLLWANQGHAERFKQRGVAIPDAPDLIVQGTTRLNRNESGADLNVPLDAGETWELLIRVLADLGIKPQQQDAQRQHLLSGWILWVWDPALKTGRSKPPLKVLSRTYERHRFDFSVSTAVANSGAVVHISDNTRQMEVDITPDSAYSWLDWRDAETQTDAAWSFMRRLQGNFESALSSRLVPSGVAVPRIIEPARSSMPIRKAPPVAAPAPAVIVEPVRRLPAPVPVPSQPVTQQNSDKRSERRTPTVEFRQSVDKVSTGVVNTPPPTVPNPTVEPQSAEQTQTGPKNTQSMATAPPRSVAVQSASEPLAVQGGLLVDGEPGASWRALLRALDALGISLQSSDQAQHMLSTQWTNGRYDKKNQQFMLESHTGERWAFDLWGKGRERHRFQLILIPVDGGARTMVYAYHTGFQVETDRTPDSSQTLLYWKDHKTDPVIAMAFLRRLRLMVRQ